MPQNFLSATTRFNTRVAARRYASWLKRLAWRCGAALNVWSTPDTNPFLQRALRIETRKHKPLVTALGCLLAAFLVNVVGWWLWQMWQTLPRAPHWAPGTFPRALGSNFVGFVGILTTAVCACAVLYASRARTTYLLRQEFLKDTLDQLHLLPIAEERWLWMMSAHPLALALLIGSLGLPVYFLQVFTGQWSLLDVIGLFVVFVMLGFSVPMWQPVFWKSQSARKRRQGFDIKKWRAALARVKADFDPARMTPEQRMELERRVQRAMVDMQDDTTGAAADTASTLAPAAKRSGASFGSLALPSRAAQTGLGWLLVNVFFQVTMRGGGGPFGSLTSNLYSVLPASIAPLLPAFPLTWPLILARLCFTPLPFFAFALPPVVLLAPLWIGFSHQKLLVVAANVSNAETFWTTRRARRRRAIGILLWILMVALVFGYGWHALMIDGEICALLPGTGPGANWALAAAWTFVIVAATIAAGMTLETPLTRRVGESRLERAEALNAWRAAAHAIVRSLGIALVAYFVFCWIGGLSGVSGAWITRLLPTVATAAAFLLADFGSGALQSACAGRLRTLWRVLRWLWFFGLALEALALVLRGSIIGTAFSFDQAPHVLFSPFVSLFAFFREPAWQPEVQLGLLVQATLGTLSFAVALVLTLRPALAAETTGHSILDLLLAPFFLLYRLWRAFWDALGRFIAWIKKLLSSCEEAIIRRAARYDNPVLTAHLRWKIRREHWPMQWLGALSLGALLMLGFGFVPMFLFILDKINGTALGPTSPGTSFADFLDVWGTVVVYVVLGFGWFLSGVAGLDAGMAFDRDRASGSLVFLFLTPLTDKAIVGGKLIVGFFDVLFLLLTGLPWLLIGCLAGVLGGNLELPIVGIVGVAAVLSTLTLAICLQTLFAVRAIKPGEGTVKAFLVGGCVEAAIAILLGYILGLIAEISFGPQESRTAFLVIGMLALTITHLLLAYIAWRLTLFSMRRIRYGDVTVGGKATG